MASNVMQPSQAHAVMWHEAYSIATAVAVSQEHEGADTARLSISSDCDTINSISSIFFI